MFFFCPQKGCVGRGLQEEEKMDKFSNRSELYIYTDIELQFAFRIATEDLASHDAETVKSAHHALQEIKVVQRGRKP